MKKTNRKKVLLVCMPFGALERPALGLSLLKAKLSEIGVPCEVEYLNLPLAEFIGCEEYQWVNYELPYTAFAGDWLFTESLYGPRPETDRLYIQRVLRETWQLGTAELARLMQIRLLLPHFLQYCLESVAWNEYALVGFTSTFEQNIASLTMARLLKERYPHLVVVFGGANWEAGMGLELHRQFACVDYVCSGESEESFPMLVQRILNSPRNGRELQGQNRSHRVTPKIDVSDIRGIVYRTVSGASVFTGPPELIRDMDALPIPDFSDYFHAIAQSSATVTVTPSVLLETSRGCWWGAKSHCTFCGLNGGAMAFRSKSPRRTLDELEYLTDRWRTDSVEAVDNILDMKYFDNVLPALAQAQRPFQVFYEVKANLNRRHLELLCAAGVTRIQPGIESMSDHILKLMRKGTTALKNIQLLKWCQEYGITAEWNILYGFPGETREDYQKMLELLRSVRFLRPPTACGPVRLDRFSPYFNTPTEFGLTNVRPFMTYQFLYPFPPESLHRIAYYFDYDYCAEVNPRDSAAEVIAYTDEWQRWPESGMLISIRSDQQTLLLLDTRADATSPRHSLSGLECEAYEYCDEMHTGADVTRHLRSLSADQTIHDEQVKSFLDSLVENRLMVTDGKYYLSLAIRRKPVRPGQPMNGVKRKPVGEASGRRPLSSYLPRELKVLQADVLTG